MLKSNIEQNVRYSHNKNMVTDHQPHNCYLLGNAAISDWSTSLVCAKSVTLLKDYTRSHSIQMNWKYI